MICLVLNWVMSYFPVVVPFFPKMGYLIDQARLFLWDVILFFCHTFVTLAFFFGKNCLTNFNSTAETNKKLLKAVWPDCEALTFDLETWNLQYQGHRQRSQWKQLMKLHLHLMCERVIDHGLGTMKLNANYFFFN